MTLATRISLFFLLALAVVLAGFSLTVHTLASDYLYHREDDRLAAALRTLAATAEMSLDGVEWEVAEHPLDLGSDGSANPIVWRVRDDRGRRLDGSPPMGASVLLTGAPLDSSEPRWTADAARRPWRLARIRIEPAIDEADRAERAPPAESIHRAVCIDAAISLQATVADLRRLDFLLVATSCGVWLVALVCGRWFSQRALKPLRVMAASVDQVNARLLDHRLPMPETGDELEALARSFNDLLNRLQESFERQRRFTGDASHQLRTPLTAMQGQVDLALRQVRDPDEYQRVLAVIQRKTRQMRRIVEALLFLARSDDESVDPETERLDLSAWLPGHLAANVDASRADDLTLMPVPPNLAVNVHATLLGELINNLVDNACRYSLPGSPVIVWAEQVAETVHLTVQDQGQGIPSQDLDEIFTPFFRSAEARRTQSQGLGLGLAVALRVARRFGGTIAVESCWGEGSRFTLILPKSPPLTGEPFYPSQASTEAS